MANDVQLYEVIGELNFEDGTSQSLNLLVPATSPQHAECLYHQHMQERRASLVPNAVGGKEIRGETVFSARKVNVSSFGYNVRLEKIVDSCMEGNTTPSQQSERKPYSDFLPHFSALVELGNYSEDLRKSMELARATQTVYERMLNDNSDPFHDTLRQCHENWWLQARAGEIRIYRFTTQYMKPAMYRVTVSCDNGEGVQYFSRTTEVFDNSDKAEQVACTIIRKAIRMFIAH